MQYALQKLAEEETRAVRYLETQPEFNSVPKLMKVCLKTFVVDYMVSFSSIFYIDMYFSHQYFILR